MSLPVLRLTGTPYAQGLGHGRALKDDVRHNLSVYFDRFLHEAKLPREAVIDRAKQYLAAIQRQNTDYYEGMCGIAAGTGADLDALAALNVRYEILYHQFGLNAMVDGCTSFAVLPAASANSHLLLGQNWDWIPQIRGAVIHSVEADGLEVISFTEAGIFGGKIGLNDAGLGLTVNGMTSTDDDWSRLSKPFHVRCYEILRTRTFEAAVQVVTGDERSCSTNFMIAQAPDQVVDIEAAPNTVRLLHCQNGRQAHTNHFLDPEVLGVVEPPSQRRPYSKHRQSRMTGFLQRHSPITFDDLKYYLKDHEEFPNSLCRHEDPQEAPEDHYITVTSVIMDLHAGTIYLSDGPPCQSDYQRVTFNIRN